MMAQDLTVSKCKTSLPAEMGRVGGGGSDYRLEREGYMQ